MYKFFMALVLVPLGLILIVFAVANRHLVTVAFDPLNLGDTPGSVTLPLFALVIGVAILGVLAGGIATWIRQRHWRRDARRHAADAAEARAQLADLRASIATPARSESPRLLGRDSASERDKAGATL
ncbi:MULTISPECIES: lipopolysaccharide assembly protein LapA domain-containing protein [Rhodopseudomonas]|uniref:Lipopolysaccharide assembly protein A domain-containing protein n=1 Tax=Rhodopseudomonas palustris TaxID=1076 RepID=A0A0D7E0Y8_RHOPL|nr:MULTISPECIES: lipopolysaccharide assembly protein LapA domain-containing protein [Rhodopseudomonas]KIZ34494.1 hypothetical protein OO17_26780 [Rhodopseudomonas palustris]MDF3810471.1 lipopolysaccharide assembly protein LapA domain-containing protein [Rhodopseudomonas sp. BAL398]WOK16215.1 lipopolysaccharide assembly protein LapA domain-containing protein [Rhodopseudomonas sp. BAL398]